MRLRPGMVISALLTIVLSLGIAYLSMSILEKVPLLSSLGLIASISLILISTIMLKGKEVAILLLSIFYIVLGVLGLLLIPVLPSEGMLTFLFSVTIGSYLLRHRRDPYRSGEFTRAEGELLAGEPLGEVEGGEDLGNSGDEPPLGGNPATKSTSDYPMGM